MTMSRRWSPSRLWKCWQAAGLSKRRASGAAFPQPPSARARSASGAGAVEPRQVRVGRIRRRLCLEVAWSLEGEEGGLGAPSLGGVIAIHGLATGDPIQAAGLALRGQVRLADMNGSRAGLPPELSWAVAVESATQVEGVDASNRGEN